MTSLSTIVRLTLAKPTMTTYCRYNFYRQLSRTMELDNKKATDEDQQYETELSFIPPDEEIFARRCQEISLLKDSGFNPYPYNFKIDEELPEFRTKYGDLQPGSRLPDVSTAIAGRIISIRDSSKNLFFYDVHGQGGKVQVVANNREYRDTSRDFTSLTSTLQRGDVIGCRGFPFKTRTGELSLMVREVQLLSPCLRPIPAPYYGLKDIGARYRQRHIDLIMNDKSRQTFLTRAKIISCLRKFLEDKGFLEVETPIMHSIPGGASARPFKTHHNDLKSDLYLRVAPELHLKRLVVGGLDRVFEIGKQFRNEGVDSTHNPEFTTLEMYMAFADYEDMLTMTEEMLCHVIRTINGGSLILKSAVGEEDLDFTPPFKRIKYMDELQTATGEEINPETLDSAATISQLTAICNRFSIPLPTPLNPARLLDKLVQHCIEDKIVGPTIIIDHPQITSPLAKPHRDIPGLCERFELFVQRKEILNAYSEMNDPVMQRAAFQTQMGRRETGDEEAMAIDEDYCRVLDYGLPPTAGLGLGIDRLTIILTNSPGIKHVLLFPVIPIQSQ